MIGYTAAILVTIAYLPQLYTTIKTRKCDMNWGTLGILFVAMILWSIHAVNIKDNSLFLSSFLSTAQLTTLILYKVEEIL